MARITSLIAPATLLLCGLGCGSSAGWVNQDYFTPHIDAVSGSNQTANKNTNFPLPLKAHVISDSSGVKVEGSQVIFKLADGTLLGTTVMADGWASLPVTAPAAAGPFNAKAAMGYQMQGAWDFTLTVTDNPAASLQAVSGYPTSAAAGSPFAGTFQVKAVDASGLAVAGLSVVFQAPSSGASCSLDGSGSTVTKVTDQNGLATVTTVVANATTGSYTIGFSSGAMNGSFAVSNL